MIESAIFCKNIICRLGIRTIKGIRFDRNLKLRKIVVIGNVCDIVVIIGYHILGNRNDTGSYVIYIISILLLCHFQNNSVISLSFERLMIGANIGFQPFIRNVVSILGSECQRYHFLSDFCCF